MEDTQTPEPTPATETMQTMLFQGPNFTLRVPSTWLVTSNKDVQVIFLGPQIGNVRAAFGIELGTDNEVENLSDFIEQYNNGQSSRSDNFEIKFSADHSKDNYQAIHQIVQAKQPGADMKLEKNQVFYLLEGTLIIIATTQPADTDVRNNIQDLFVKMINTFRFGKLGA